MPWNWTSQNSFLCVFNRHLLRICYAPLWRVNRVGIAPVLEELLF